LKTTLRQFDTRDNPVIAPLFPEDWHFDFADFIRQHGSQPYFRAVTLLAGEKPIGYGNLFIFGTAAWVGNVVVAPENRRQGLGTRLTRHLITLGRGEGAKTFYLVATELGKPIYRKLGFTTEGDYRFLGTGPENLVYGESSFLRPISEEDLPTILEMDTVITGEKRGTMLARHLKDAWVAEDRFHKLRGFFLPSLGDGLILANGPDYGVALIKKKIMLHRGPMVVPGANTIALDFLLEQGFRIHLKAPRMVLGPHPEFKGEYIYSRGSGYCG
jgi:GNAT superfamily N-acetyltransferase